MWGKREDIKLLTIEEEFFFFSFTKIADNINNKISVPKFTNIYSTWTPIGILKEILF